MTTYSAARILWTNAVPHMTAMLMHSAQTQREASHTAATPDTQGRACRARTSVRPGRVLGHDPGLAKRAGYHS
eukprot:3167564-Rhodomonas_salina.1